ncbi:MAG TPA: biotin carboxylase N-terminal domain-containing protein, partial [Reyranella sp.]|nr:biotin carboxylase N-terminal domain-containing protein [Reyranella sp.]
MFKRVLIANRGEIAIRIARAAASLGVDSVAIFTRADAMSLHTKLAGSAREIGGDAVRGYLDIEAVIDAAKASGCDCVHPGYGFLSENTLFAERCEAGGLRFIGPSPASLKLFGDKVEARTFAQTQGIPVIPGAPKLASSDDAKARAKAIGYPVMLKASAGGGGRGMRAVTRPEEMDEAFARCQGEAEAAFGDRALFLEKIVPRPRHIEVQVLGDGQGNVVHLFERDCSVQLRNQKVVEVAPAPNLDEGLRHCILADAVKLARAARYENAGTVEFLVNPETSEHFFIECNPRIQVEHTITEQVMGFDLVEAQFRIAAGGSLASLGLADQKAVGTPRGFAVQARVVAQGTGTLSAYREPSGPGVRVDACGYVGLAPPPQFDPLLAKLICQSGSSGCFDSAVDRTRRALDEFHIVGVPTNGDQLRAILAHPEFRAGNARTTLLAEAIEPAKAKTGALQFLDQQVASLGRGRGASAPPARPLPVPPGHEAIESPHAGSIVDIKVREGAEVKAGDLLFVVSAMKMETSVAAPCSGIVATLASLSVGDAVDGSQILAVIKPAAGAAKAAPTAPADEGWTPMLDKVTALQAIAHKRLAPGSTDPGVV